MSAAFRVALVGAGYFSQFHLAGWRAVAGAQCIALCDRNRALAEEQARRHGIAAVYEDAEAMLDAVRPDLLDIVTPPATHAALVASAVSRKVAVVCQKPLADTYGAARAIVEAAAGAGVPLVVHENFRFMPWHREAQRFIASGRLGAPHGIAFRLRPGDGQGPRAYLDRQPYFQRMTRFLVHETAIHFIDTFRFLMGEVVAVYARLRRLNPAIAGEDAGHIVLEFASGAAGLIDGNRLNDHQAANPRRTHGEMWLEGAAGVLRLDGDARLWWKPHGGEEREHPYDRGPADTFGGGACAALQRHLVAHFRDGAAVENAGPDYLQNLKVEEAVYASHATGRRIALADFDPEAAPAPG